VINSRKKKPIRPFLSNNPAFEGIRRLRNPDLFDHDDYSQIQQKYFADLREHGGADADPSGWLQTYSSSGALFVFPALTSDDIGPYYIDEGDALGEHKEAISRLLSKWDGSPIAPEHFTLCPSGGTASLITLAALKEHGVKRILFETPSYFGTVEQANQLEIDYDLIPTYRRDGYALPDMRSRLHSDDPIAIWLTHPRASLGINQSREYIEQLLERMTPQHYLVVDEVTDQTFPAHLGALHANFPSANLVRIRSFLKGMGYNGVRLSAILHTARLRGSLVDAVESLGGSLDAHSLFAVKLLANDIPRFRAMLRAANEQVNDLRRKAEEIVRGSLVSINPLVNGYIGSTVVDLKMLGETQRERRTRLLEACRSLRTPVSLGASFYLAKDPPTEAIRLNFLTHPDQLLRGIANIVRAVEGPVLSSGSTS